MPSRNITTKFSLDGEKEFKQAVSEINSGMKVLKSEMELTSAQFKDSADSMEALTKKGDILERQILSQKEKIDVLREAVSRSAAAHGESDKRTQNWIVSLNKAEAELADMNRELDENQRAIEQTGEATEEGSKKFKIFSGEAMGLGDALNKVGDKLGIQIPEGMTKSLNGLVKINPAVVGLGTAFAALAVAIHKAEEKLKEMTEASAAYADEILTTATVTGMSTEALQEWSYASELMDVSIETVTGSMTKMIRSMNDARDGTGKAKDTFGELGVSILDTEGKLRDSEDVFWETITALGNIKNATERDAASMEIFGKSAQDLNPLILAGRDGFEELAEEAHKAGAVLDGEALAALGAVDDAQQRLLQSQEAVTHQISKEYAPYMEDSLTMTKDLVDDIGKALVDSGAVQSFGSILTSVQSLLDPLKELGTVILPPVAFVLEGIATTLAWIADTANAAWALLTLNPERWSTAMGTNPYQASNMQKVQFGANYKTESYGGNVWDPELGAYVGNYHNAGGTRNWRGGGTWVGESGPEYVQLPAGSQIYSAQDSRKVGGDIFNFYINAENIRELNDLIAIVESARVTRRMGGGN